MKICQLIDFVNVGGAGIAANRIADAILANIASAILLAAIPAPPTFTKSIN